MPLMSWCSWPANKAMRTSYAASPPPAIVMPQMSWSSWPVENGDLVELHRLAAAGNSDAADVLAEQDEER